MSEREKACEGGRTVNVDPLGDFVECQHCGTEIRWDMQDHPWWGFQNCRQRALKQPDDTEKADGRLRGA